jgi:hypothetical protein
MIKQYGEGTAIICDFCGVKLQFDGNKSGKEAQIALKSQGWVEQGEKNKCTACQQSRADIPKLIEQLTAINEQFDAELETERNLLKEAEPNTPKSCQRRDNCVYLLEAVRNIESALSELRRLK